MIRSLNGWVLFLLLSTGACHAAPFAYIPNRGSNDVSVIDVATNTVSGPPIAVGIQPYGVAANTQGTRVYVTNYGSNNVSVIGTGTNSVVATIPVGANPQGIAVNAAGTRVYVVNGKAVSVIDTATNTVIATSAVIGAVNIAVNPADTRVYVTTVDDTVAVIDTATNAVVATLPAFLEFDEWGDRRQPIGGIAMDPTGSRVYVTYLANHELPLIPLVRAFDAQTNQILSALQGGFSGIAVDPQSRDVFTVDMRGLWRVDPLSNAVKFTSLQGVFPLSTSLGGALDPTGSRYYVIGAGGVFAVDTATLQPIGAAIPVGSNPVAVGQFISPGPPPPTTWWRDTLGGSVATWQFPSADPNQIIASFLPTVPTNWEARHVADIDGDGVPDIVWFDEITGQVAIWLMQSSTQIKSTTFPASVGVSDWKLDAVADVNGDGHADFVWRNAASGQLLVWYMSADGTLAGTHDYGNVPLSFELRGAGDLNGDGIADLVWFERSDGVVAVWMMHADASFSAAFPAAVGAGTWRPYTIADLDGDGNADLLWRNEADGSLAAWYMNGGALADFDFFVSVPLSEWTLGAATDFNADGRADLLWYRTAGGNPVRWLMKGRHVPVQVESLTDLGAGWTCIQ